ncbi:MAG: ABC transporter substrate-binding protein [Gracilibacteraceae bacterium]|nr:ABC transporter substrate-binding protein [Gracilibacteraceae bacterium]
MSKSIAARLLTVLACLLLLLTTACGGGAPPAANPPAANTPQADPPAADDSAERVVRMTHAGGYAVDPHLGTDSAGTMLSVNLYDSLVFPELDGSVSPCLATEWTVSADGLTWDFTLREDVKFHDGADLTASDVVYSMNRILALGQGYSYLFSGYIQSVEATGDYGVRFTLGKPFAPFLRILPRLYVLNEDLVRANQTAGSYGDNGDYGLAYLAEHDAGSGAYFIEEVRVQDRVTMKRFDEYFGEFANNAPTSAEVITGTEAATVRTLMTNKQLEISDQWQTSEAYEALARLDGVTLGSFASGQMLFVMLNTKKAPTDDVHVRRALAHLIDYAQVCESLFPGFEPPDSPLPADLPGHTLTPVYEFSLEKAREELAQSAYASDLGAVTVDLAWIAEVPDEEKLSLLIQANASQIGLKVNVIKVPWSAYVEQVGQVDTTPNAGICFMASDYDEAGSLLYQRYHSDTAGTWQQIEWLEDPAIDAKIDEALTTIDQEARYAVYADLQNEIMDQVYGISVANQIQKYAYSDSLVWPAMDAAAAGKPVSTLLGYNLVLRTFEVNK